MPRFRVALVASLLAAGSAFAADPPATESVRLPITRDNWFSGVGGEADGNNGAAPKLKAKSIQEMSVLDFDPAPLRGRIVKQAALHWKSASPADPLKRVTVGTVSSEWVEGRSTSYEPERGASSFNHRRNPNEPWAFPGSQLTNVMLGQGGSVWRMADATPPDEQGWQHAAVEPAIVTARVSGVSQGLLLFDDTGSDWTRDGETFTRKLFPNRFIHSRDSNASSAPYLTVELGGRDDAPPAAPGAVAAPKATSTREPVVEAVNLAWTTPQDDGAGVVGFLVEINGKLAPRWLIPAPGRPGQAVVMRLLRGDMDLAPPEVQATIKAVDGAGNVGPAFELRQPFAGWAPPFQWSTPAAAEASPDRPADAKGLVNVGGAELFVVDPLDKVHPVTGAMIPAQPAGYTTSNHVWSQGVVTLHAARNEFVGFQLVVKGAAQGLRPTLTFDSADAEVETSWSRYRHVATKQGPLPDPLLPLTEPFSVPTPDEKIAGQKFGELLGEVYVSHNCPPGVHKGKLKLQVGGGYKVLATIPVELTVHDFTLPDRLSFLPEMNCYGLPANERDYYRLAHRHRTVMNRVPYSQAGAPADGCTPRWNEASQSFDWTAWDERFGPLFDGSLFKNSPRKGVPIEAFYLPIHENWPAPMAGNYNGNYWADEAFPASYRNKLVQATQAFATHLNSKKWNATLFQGFLNNKVDFKLRGWSRGSSPWLLDEPANWQDYWALKYFGEALHEGWRSAAQDGAKFVYRCDVSRPEWQRDALDAVLDYNVVSGGAFYQHHRLVLDRRDRFGQFVVVYGGTNAVAASNTQPVGWCLDAWSLGADGVVPWQTVGNGDSWQQDDELSLFYPGESIGLSGPIPSVRLKAYLRGQQDVEYLALLQASKQASRLAVGDAARAVLKLRGVRAATGYTGPEDAGIIQFGDLKPQDLAALRRRIATELNGQAKPAVAIVETPIPHRDFALASVGRVSTEPPIRVLDEPAVAQPAGPASTLQGREVVADALIDPKQPDKNLSGGGRDNRLFKNDATSAWLIRFDLAKLKRPAEARVQKATLHFYVWDPAGSGQTKVGAGLLKSAWDEAAACWNKPTATGHWSGGAHFDLAREVGPLNATVVVAPDVGEDVADPPVEYRIDVTEAVSAWLNGAENHGLVVTPIPDRQIDDGASTRFQVHSSRSSREYGPKLTIEWKR